MPGFPPTRSKDTVFGVRPTVSQVESSKEVLAQSGAWVTGSGRVADVEFPGTVEGDHAVAEGDLAEAGGLRDRGGLGEAPGPAQARARNNVTLAKLLLCNITLYDRIADATALYLVDTDDLKAIYKTASQAASLPCGRSLASGR